MLEIHTKSFLLLLIFCTFYYGNFQIYAKETRYKILKQKKYILDRRLKHFVLKIQSEFLALFASWIISKIITELARFSVILVT